MCGFKKATLELLKSPKLVDYKKWLKHIGKEERERIAEQLTFVFQTEILKSYTSKMVKPPLLYKDRPDIAQTPVDFLEEQWGIFLHHDHDKSSRYTSIFQDQLKEVDRDLYYALKGYLPKRNIETKDLVPPKTERIRRLSEIGRLKLAS